MMTGMPAFMVARRAAFVSSESECLLLNSVPSTSVKTALTVLSLLSRPDDGLSCMCNLAAFMHRVPRPCKGGCWLRASNVWSEDPSNFEGETKPDRKLPAALIVRCHEDTKEEQQYGNNSISDDIDEYRCIFRFKSLTDSGIATVRTLLRCFQ